MLAHQHELGVHRKRAGQSAEFWLWAGFVAGFVKPGGINMGFKVIDGNEWFPLAKRHGFGSGNPQPPMNLPDLGWVTAMASISDGFLGRF